jgi:hypothetical protein
MVFHLETTKKEASAAEASFFVRQCQYNPELIYGAFAEEQLLHAECP